MTVWCAAEHRNMLRSVLIVQNISCLVTNSAKKKEKLHLLHNVSGSVAAGEMTALVRPAAWQNALLEIARCHTQYC